MDNIGGNMEIGEYVRTKRGYIARVVYIGEFIELDKAINFRRTSGNFYSGQNLFDDEEELEITKHSKNIIDLIEVGDIVNHGERVLDMTGDYVHTTERSCCKTRFERTIKTILTHEQYEQNCYKLKE